MFIRIDELQPLTESGLGAGTEGRMSSNGKLTPRVGSKRDFAHFSLTHDLKWGFPVPVKGMEDKVLYVLVRCSHRIPNITANYTDDWKSGGRTGQRQALPIYGQGQRPFPHRHLPLLPDRQQGSIHPFASHQHHRIPSIRRGKFSKSRNIGVFGDKARDLVCRHPSGDTTCSPTDPRLPTVSSRA